MTELKIEQWPIERLVPYCRNPRRNDDAVPKMAGLIKEFGFKVPIVARSDGEVVDGHLRLKAAQFLKMETVPVVLADDWTPAQVKAFRLAVNKSAEWAEWDEELLALEIEDLKLEDFDLELIGFEELSLDGEETEGLTDPDEVPEVQETPVSKLGDIWLLGNHRLMCGDSTDAGSVRRLMNEEHGKILFTSPPYSDIRTYNNADKDLSPSHLAEFISVYEPFTDYQIVNLGIQIRDREIIQYWDEYINVARKIGYKLMSWLVWDKEICGGIGQQKHFIPTRHEFIFVFGKEVCNLNKIIPKKAENVKTNYEATTRRQKNGTLSKSSQGDQSNPYKTIESIVNVLSYHEHLFDHPAIFPVELPIQFIKTFANAEDIVIEPFSGSGTTIIACEQSNCSCRAMELSPQYVDLAICRWQDFTGKEATLESSGKTFAQVKEERG